MPQPHPFIRLCRANVESYDYDCIYPLTRALCKNLRWNREQVTRFCFYYMAFYNESSAIVHMHDSKYLTKLPIDTARRCLRGGKIKLHMDALAKIGWLSQWLDSHLTKDPEESWEKVYVALTTIYGNGRWASYTTLDMLHKVTGLKVRPPHTYWRVSSGPRKGLSLLENNNDLDSVERRWFALVSRKITHPHEPWDYGVFESLLCDYAGLTKGSYYGGRNIDRMLNRMDKVINAVGNLSCLEEILRARIDAFPIAVLGEHNGWFGIDLKRKKHFATTGEVLWADQNRSSIKGATSLISFIKRYLSG